MLRHAFEDLGMLRVEFKTDSATPSRVSALARIGAAEEGTFRNHMVMPNGDSRHSVYFSIIAGEWPTVKANLEARLKGSSRLSTLRTGRKRTQSTDASPENVQSDVLQRPHWRKTLLQCFRGLCMAIFCTNKRHAGVATRRTARQKSGAQALQGPTQKVRCRYRLCTAVVTYL